MTLCDIRAGYHDRRRRAHGSGFVALQYLRRPVHAVLVQREQPLDVAVVLLQPPARRRGKLSGSHPGDNPGANRKPISHRCHLCEVAFVWELTKEAIHWPLGCLQGG